MSILTRIAHLDTIEKKPGVPENANTMEDTTLMAVVKDGLPMIL